MTHKPRLRRRALLAALPALALAGRPASAAPLDAADFGIVPDIDADQTPMLQAAIDAAAGGGRILQLPAGTFPVSGLVLRDGLVLEGMRGRTVLAAWLGGPVAGVAGVRALTLSGIVFDRGNMPADPDRGLLEISGSSGIGLYRCAFQKGEGSGLVATDSQVVVDDCDFSGLGNAGLHSQDGRGMTITRCRISNCGNAGIRIWRGASGSDPSIISGNRISAIDWRGGGNGQNGNGINIFQADEVIIAGNHISRCAFTAVRLNSTNNTQVSGNICLDSGEVAIFSEFAFSGSVIANNIIDGAAGGISITNFDQGGQLAVCSGNIVRNITPVSPVNPDASPTGIFAEADTAITGNTVQNVPGVAIGAGYGPFLRNVLISGNVIGDSAIGIGVTVVEEAGAVHIADNMIRNPTRYAAVGLRWDEVAEPDLFANADRYANVSVDGNVVS